MSVESGPRKLSELLDASFRLVRERASLLTGLALLLYVPIALMLAGIGEIAPEGGQWKDHIGVGALVVIVGGVVIVGLVILAIWPLIVGALVAACLDLFGGNETDFERAIAAARRRYGHLVWTITLLSLYALGVMLALALPVAGLVWLGRIAGPLGSGFGTALAIGGVFIAGPILFLVAVFLQGYTQLLIVVTIDDVGSADEAIARAWRLAWPERWRVIRLAVVLWLVAVVPGSLAELALGALPLIGAVAWGIVQALVMAFVTATWVGLYLDQDETRSRPRPRTEALRSPLPLDPSAAPPEPLF